MCHGNWYATMAMAMDGTELLPITHKVLYAGTIDMWDKLCTIAGDYNTFIHDVITDIGNGMLEITVMYETDTLDGQSLNDYHGGFLPGVCEAVHYDAHENDKDEYWYDLFQYVKKIINVDTGMTLYSN